MTINEEQIRGYIQTLQDIGPRVTGSPESQQTADYIFQEFQQMNLTTTFHPWSNGDYEDINVEAILPGEKEESIIICAHHDSVPGSPGADDNGSGTAAVLAAAKALSTHKDTLTLTYTIRFITFSGEEQGLYGSYNYAAHAHDNNMNIAGVLNADMIGYAQSEMGKEWIYISEDESSNWITNMSNNVAETYREFIGLNISQRRAYPNSDHWPFIEFGYDAVGYHEYEFNDYYHSPEDTIDKMDLNYDMRATRLIVATLLQTSEIIDTEPPQVSITTPKEGYLYIADREIMPSFTTIIIGKITITLHAHDTLTGIEKIDLYINNQLKTTLITRPYEYQYDEPAIFSHRIHAVAYDNAGNTANTEHFVWIFNI